MLKLFTLICCLAAIATAGVLLYWLKRKNPIESNRVDALNGYIITGFGRYLRVGVLYSLIPAVLVFFLLLLAVDQITAGMYAVGVGTGLADSLLVSAAVIVGNTRFAGAAVHGDMDKAKKLAFYTAVICGLGTVGISVLALLLAFWTMNYTLFIGGLPGFLLGITMVAYLGRCGGEFFTKVNDVVDSLLAATVAVLILAPSAVEDAGVNATFTESRAGVFALVLLGIGIIASLVVIIGIHRINQNYGVTLDQAVLIVAVICGLASIPLAIVQLDNIMYAFSVISGIVAACVGEYATRIYTDSTDHKVREVVRKGGKREAVLERLSTGMSAAILPVICLTCGMGMAYYFAGNYGIGLAAVGMVSVSGILLTLQGLVILTRTGGTVIDIVGTEDETRLIEGEYNAFRKSLNRSRNGISSSAACMSSVALLISMAHSIQIGQVALLNPMVVCGSLIGIMFPFAFSSRSMTFSGSALRDMSRLMKRRYGDAPKEEISEEVQKEMKQSVGASAKSTMFGLFASGIVTLLVPILIAIIIGPEMLAGLLIGAIVSGVLLGAIMVNAGSIFRNISDSSIYIVIKLMVIVSLAFSTVFTQL